MVDPKLQSELASSKAGDILTVVLQWTAPLDPKVFAKIASPKDRMQLLDQHFREIKAPVLDSLTGFPDIQLKNLPSSGSAIITTTANRLRQLISKSGILGSHDEVEVLPNERFHTLASAT